MKHKSVSKKVVVRNSMQHGYAYELTEPMGKNFAPEFKPDFTPKQMLELGVFGGKYLNSAKAEYPKEWFVKAKMSDVSEPKLNYFRVSASQPLAEWRRKGWISEYDPRGWFEWYCRYYMGRRIADEDKRQIKRWKAMKRHLSQIANNCRSGDTLCRPRQRQALLHWAYDTRGL
jgi:hypothetical protein